MCDNELVSSKMRKYFYSLCKIAAVTFVPITIERVGHRMQT